MVYAGALRVSPEAFPDPELDPAPAAAEGRAVLAGGCFWCVEEPKTIPKYVAATERRGRHQSKAGRSGGERMT